MGRCIVKLAENEYIEWSTVVDAPVSYVMTRSEVPKFIRGDDISERLSRADEFGTSMLAPNLSLQDMIGFNRAGPKESCISLEGIRSRYRKEQDK